MKSKEKFKFPLSVKGILILALVALMFIPGCKKEEELTIPGNKEAVGATAFHLLSELQFRNLVVEVMYMDGHAPTAESIENMESFLNSHLKKPGGIYVEQRSIGSEGQETYSTQDIRNIEDANRQMFNVENTLAISFIFLDGEYADNSGDSKVLGLAYRNTSMAIFQKTVLDNSGGLTQPSQTKLESTIVNHEIGHILGLVNHGTPMNTDHQDNAHGYHCDNSNCLMYYAVETTDIVDNLIGNSIPELDGNCKEDLVNNGGQP